ncbi:MAG: hypothetical protein M3Q19_11005 [Pseudomonadota bacterium]|nr:hypothetical protein [Pseudomonadota bacterium]
MGVVIVLSGAIGSRRSELAEKLEQRLHWPRVKFSNYIKQRIQADGDDPDDRLMQQQYGQRLVQNHLKAFVEGVLAMAPNWQLEGGNLIVDGLRHVEVLLVLRELLADESEILYVHVKPDPLRRESGARERGLNEQDMYRYDRALSEAQMNRILPAYADLEVDASLGIGLAVQDIEKQLKELGVEIAA